LYLALRNHDFRGFAQEQLKLRREHGFPPYSHLAVLRVESLKAGAAARFAQRAHEAAGALARGVTVFDPVSAPLARLAGRERWQVVFQSPSRPALQHFLSPLEPALDQIASRDVRWAIDVDPLEV
jgi:primosomal protein N' (replication factor Y)